MTKGNSNSGREDECADEIKSHQFVKGPYSIRIPMTRIARILFMFVEPPPSPRRALLYGSAGGIPTGFPSGSMRYLKLRQFKMTLTIILIPAARKPQRKS